MLIRHERIRLEQSITIHGDNRGKVNHHAVSGGINCCLETLGGNLTLKQHDIGGSNVSGMLLHRFCIDPGIRAGYDDDSVFTIGRDCDDG